MPFITPQWFHLILILFNPFLECSWCCVWPSAIHYPDLVYIFYCETVAFFGLSLFSGGLCIVLQKRSFAAITPGTVSNRQELPVNGLLRQESDYSFCFVPNTHGKKTVLSNTHHKCRNLQACLDTWEVIELRYKEQKDSRKHWFLSLLLNLKFISVCLQITEEGSTVSCVVERTRGALDYVHVFYTISQIESEGINYLVDDFANASGIITFLPWQRSEVTPWPGLLLMLLGKCFIPLFIHWLAIPWCLCILYYLKN